MNKHPRPTPPTHPLPKPTPAPSTSWWLGLSREAFQEQLKVEAERMSGAPSSRKDRAQ